MKLKSYNATNCQARILGTFVTISKSGMLSISSEACRLIGIKDNTKVEFFQDEESPEDWYIGLSKAEGAFHIRAKEKNGVYCIQNAFLARTIRDSIKFSESGSARFMISKEFEQGGGTGKVFAIITKSAKSSLRKTK